MIVGDGIEYKDFDHYENERFYYKPISRGYSELWHESLNIDIWPQPNDADPYPKKLGTLWMETFIKKRKAVIRNEMSFGDNTAQLQEAKRLLIENIQDVIGKDWICFDRTKTFEINNTLWRLESEVETHIGKLQDVQMKLHSDNGDSFDPTEIVDYPEKKRKSEAWEDVSSAIKYLELAQKHINRAKQSLETLRSE